MHRLPGHPDLGDTSVTVAPANTARTASNRCSTTDNTTSAKPGLPTTRTPHGDAGDQAAEPAVSTMSWHETVNDLMAQDKGERFLLLR